MAKNEKKVEEKTTTVIEAAATTAASSAPAETSSNALVPVAPKLTVLERIAQLGVVLPKRADMDKLSAIVAMKREALSQLAGDAELSDVIRTKVHTLVDLANPIKPGMEEVSTSWAPSRIMIHQPTTTDPKKPESSKPGNLYSSSGQFVENPFPFIPLNFHEENINFEQGQKQPVCSSPDGKVGGQFGICQECVYLPFGKQHGGRGDQAKTDCQSQIVVLLLAVDLSQIYVCQFSKTSRAAGSALISLAKAQPFPWKQSYLLSTEKKVGALGTYWILKVEATAKDNSAEACKVAKVLQELYAAERKRNLAEFYLSIAAAPLNATAMEAAATAQLGTGLSPGYDEEPDLTATSGNTSVRSAVQPM